MVRALRCRVRGYSGSVAPAPLAGGRGSSTRTCSLSPKQGGGRTVQVDRHRTVGGCPPLTAWWSSSAGLSSTWVWVVHLPPPVPAPVGATRWPSWCGAGQVAPPSAHWKGQTLACVGFRAHAACWLDRTCGGGGKGDSVGRTTWSFWACALLIVLCDEPGPSRSRVFIGSTTVGG